MATKLKSHHTAGIFSDMTVDGPEIGTLVVIVDRAKNLPNRKTIGKQDPYCAARLGKEAKKTETDRRGGQTPKWDQELRFTVHDSADYYQLKVSVFNDDKKTDLIGETWVNLTDVVVAGGGTSDIWHSLACRNKYAGEIRIEITYYDTRAKQEKQERTEKPRANSVQDSGKDAVGGPRQLKAPIKRRPLPSDPITGAPAPIVIPEQVQVPPRAYPPSPAGLREQVHTPPRNIQVPAAIPEHAQTPSRGYQVQPMAIPDHVPTPPRGYKTPPSAIPEHVQTPSQGQQGPSYIPEQSPLQTVEYNTPTTQYEQPHAYEDNDFNPYSTSPGSMVKAPNSQQHQNDRYNDYEPRDDYAPSNDMDRYEDRQDDYNTHDHYDSPYEVPPIDNFGSPPSDHGGPPPPPPRHGSKQTSPLPTTPRAITNHEYNQPPQPYDIPQPAQRQLPHRSSYQAYSPPKHDQFHESPHESAYQRHPPRKQSYDSRFNRYGSMQPTVEDAPESPATFDRRYDVSSPAPLNLGGRNSAASGRNSISTGTGNHYANGSLGYASASTPSLRDLSYNESSYNGTSVSSRTSYSNLPRSRQSRSQSQDDLGGAPMEFGLPPVPPTLVPGMDPRIAAELSHRIHSEKRASLGQIVGPLSRGRPQEQYQNQPHPLSYHEAATTQFPPATSPYDDQQSRYATGTPPSVRPRGNSPNPMGSVMRKSVSPAPARDDGRRLSGIPFGPDSYNALNPVLSHSKSSSGLSIMYDKSNSDADAKIITHDGREIDPSDHIPESNYAPLLEAKGPKYASQQPDRNYRPPPTDSGRKPMKLVARPQSTAVSGPVFSGGDISPPTTRNRLQKKANRMTAQPTQSGPLVPLSSYRDHNYAPSYQQRPNTADSMNGNFAPSFGSMGYRGAAGPPPVPAKVPLAIGAPPQHHQSQRTPSGTDAWALLDEIKNIDLGTGSGRARRRQY